MDRKEFQFKAHQFINKISSKLDELEAKKDEYSDEAKKNYEEKIKEVKSKKIELDQKFELLKDASEDKWEDVRETFSSASDSFEEGFGKLLSIFKK